MRNKRYADDNEVSTEEGTSPTDSPVMVASEPGNFGRRPSFTFRRPSCSQLPASMLAALPALTSLPALTGLRLLVAGKAEVSIAELVLSESQLARQPNIEELIIYVP